jgi:hypothetical protein
MAGALTETTYQYGEGMRFTNITIPNAPIIDSAHLPLRAYASRNGTVVNTRISAEDVDDAITFADDAAAFDTRWAARTTARVNWDAIPAWTVDTDYDSPEIKTVIQEIVDREGWASGNDIVIFWDDFDDRSSHTTVTGDYTRREIYSYDGSTTKAPKLVITYTVPVTHEGAVTLSGAGALACKSILTLIGKATLDGTGSLSATGRRLYAGSVTFIGTGILATQGNLIAVGKAVMSGAGTLTAILTKVLIQYGSVLFSGIGTLITKAFSTFGKRRYGNNFPDETEIRTTKPTGSGRYG